MMRRLSQIVTLLLVCSMTLFIACEGPSGSEGPQGPEGPEGPVGPAGEDGSMMYSGQGAPDASTGETGDYYLNTDTGELYGPKDDSGWGNPIMVLMGKDGQDGEDGSQIHAGNGAPDPSLGDLGDFYLDQSNGDFYGPKTENGWGSPTNISGDDGQDGQDGEDGSTIHAGQGPPSGSMGKIGDFYLDKSTGDFYGPKTQNGWGTPTNLKGDDGEDGQDGADGEDGSQIHAGSGAPAPSLGDLGDFYLDQANYDMYGPKTNQGWGAPINLKGADGNANVTRYIFPAIDLTQQSYTTLRVSGLSLTQMKNSAWEVYVVLKGNNTNISGKYYSVPGSIHSKMYSMEYYYDKNASEIVFSIRRDPNAGGDQFDRVEIVRIEASNTNDQRKGIPGTPIPQHLDTSDYEAVAEYYGFYQ
jgi:hypothetical protein